MVHDLEIGEMDKAEMLSADKCLLLVVDIQDAFVEHIDQMDRVIERSRVMIEAARLLGLPILVTEQYPRGLGRTVAPLREVLEDIKYYDIAVKRCSL